MNAAYPRTIDLVASLGFKIQTVDISEFEKAEAGLTCMSLIFKKTP
jgi:dimethylargininase